MTATALLVFARCAGFVFRAPGFSHPSVPHAVRAGIALVLTVCLAPSLRAQHAPGGGMLLLAFAIELCIGACVGMAASILYDGAYAGGRALDDYVGIRGSVPSAQLFAPSAFGRIWSNVFLAAFFLLGGYRFAIAVFARTFDRIPPGGPIAMHAVAQFALALPVTIVEAALLVAAPAIAIVFVLQLTLGTLTRVIPRFASFTLSFPIVFLAALAATIAAIPFMFPYGAHPWMRLPFAEGP